MADFNTMTPGSAVADQIQAILQRQRDERRQAMLDRLNAENVMSTIGERTAGIEAEKERIGLAKSAETRAGKVDLENILRGRVPLFPQQRTDAGAFSPENAKYLEDLGLIQSSPGTAGQTVEHPEGLQQGPDAASFTSTSVAPSRSYIGSAKEQESEALKAEQDKAIAALIADKNANPDALRSAMLTRGGLAQGIPAAAMQGRPSVTPISPTGQPGKAIELPFGGQGMEMNWPPTPPSAYITPQTITASNPDDGGKPWNYWIIPGQPGPGQPGSKAVPIGPSIPGETGKMAAVSQTQLPAFAPAQLWTAYNNSFRRVIGESEEAWLNRRRQARSSLASNISARATTPEVRQFVGDAIVRINQLEAAGQQPPSINNIMQNASARIQGLDANEEAAIRIFMTGILNGGAAQ